MKGTPSIESILRAVKAGRKTIATAAREIEAHATAAGRRSLRDKFACCSIGGVLSATALESLYDHRRTAEWGYRMADEMLAVREMDPAALMQPRRRKGTTHD